MDRKNIDKIAENPEDRIFLAKIWDKIYHAMQKNIPGHTGFLTPREQILAQYLFGCEPGLLFWGGYDDAERKMLLYLPDYMNASLTDSDFVPMKCIRATFFRSEKPSHRDFLGALMGCGITRESVGDILVAENSCDFLVTGEIAEFVIQTFESAGRTGVKLSLISPDALIIPTQSYREIRDTVASARLDSILSAGFRISRQNAASYITAGKAYINGLVCEKPDKLILENDKISLRGFGKIKLHQIGNTTKKGRISVLIHRYE